MTQLLDGQIALVTGGDMGIGLATATGLARQGARVLITSRPPADGLDAVASIRAQVSGADVDVVPLELASFSSIRAAADRITTLAPRLDLLVNNAGGVITTHRRTDEGFEMTFGVNYLGPFLLTNLLHPALAAGGRARVVNVSSSQHRQAGELDLEALQHIGETDGIKAYNMSKLAVLMITIELSRRWNDDGVSAFAVQPGAVRSNFGRHGETGGWAGTMLRILRPLMISPAKGAGASLFCSTAPGLENDSGGYFQRGLQGNVGAVRRVAPSPHAQDAAAAAALWDLSMDLVGKA